ncbi:MAG TPA: argininosuccinate lyase [Candidatus Deferrimicrobiaceae bacterium]|nr:argininosuccinate lyase [Candidatus Deferrimicrobiaceae bacterium]
MSKILHGGRLGNVREDVAKFCSSRKDDARLADAVLAINKAHVAMLMEQKIIAWQVGTKILLALQKLGSQKLDPEAEDVHMAVEEAVLAETGPEVGGNMHVAKSRNDQVTTAIRMQLRNELQNIMQLVFEMQQALLETSSKHTETVILEYTHLQAAQPVTYGHYLLMHFDALGRDFERLQAAYAHVNLCPLGAGALATTSFPINRKTTAKLLGFDAVLENSLDAVGSRDFILETQSALTLLAVNLSRLAEDLIIWSSAEFGTVELPDEFTSTSSIMPQKKNPEVLEIIRARASYALGDFVAATAAVKSLPTTYNLDFQEVTPKLWASTDNLKASLAIFAKLIPYIKVSNDVETKTAASFVGATELANMLVLKYDVAFRTSHKIVGALVKLLVDSKKTLLDTTPQLLQKAAEKSAGVKLTVKIEDIISCTNPRKLVETYKVIGGPSRGEVERSITARKKTMNQTNAAILKMQEQVVDAGKKLDQIIHDYSLSTAPKTQDLKI